MILFTGKFDIILMELLSSLAPGDFQVKSKCHRQLEISNKYSDVDSFVKSLHDIY